MDARNAVCTYGLWTDANAIVVARADVATPRRGAMSPSWHIYIIISKPCGVAYGKYNASGVFDFGWTIYIAIVQKKDKKHQPCAHTATNIRIGRRVWCERSQERPKANGFSKNRKRPSGLPLLYIYENVWFFGRAFSWDHIYTARQKSIVCLEHAAAGNAFLMGSDRQTSSAASRTVHHARNLISMRPLLACIARDTARRVNLGYK